MLSSLHIRNYVLIDSLDISFPEGLGIITGQTGAGKSILLGAISLVMGEKADAGRVVGESAENCVVEASFTLKGLSPAVKEILLENDIDYEGELLIRRVVPRNGRSRSFINDIPVPASVLAELSSSLIDIHSQHQTLLLGDHSFQLSMLDAFAGNDSLLSECRESFRRIGSRRSELQSVRDRLSELRSRQDYIKSQLQQLDDAKLNDPEELQFLEEEQKVLSNAEQIKSSLFAVASLFAVPSAEGETSDISNNLKEAVHRLEKLSEFIPSFSSLSSRTESCRLELDDILSEVDSLNSSIDVSQERLQEVDDRLSLLYSLLRKHSCTDLQALIQLRETFRRNADDTESLSVEADALEQSIIREQEHYDSIASSLNSSRIRASKDFSFRIQESIRFLEMPAAVFNVVISPASSPGVTGRDAVSMQFSATGKNLQDVSKCASGGELSRIMLCLKQMMAHYREMPTMVFDEIDTGVSGSVADKIGTMICDMGKDMQVFAITHLPQVAAKGDAHFLVTKTISGNGDAVSRIEKLSDEQRVMEIARMLSASVVTDAAVANARDLLSRH